MSKTGNRNLTPNYTNAHFYMHKAFITYIPSVLRL